MKKKTKFLILRASIIVAFTLLAGRLWYLQVVMAGYYKAQADTSKIREEPVQALRGIIYDRNGVPLVLNAPSWNVEIVPHGISKSRAAAEYTLLSRLLGNKPTAPEIARQVEANRWRAYVPFVLESDIPPDTALLIKQLHGQLPGVRSEPATVRRYAEDPQFSLAHLLGYTGKIGKSQYEEYLREYPRARATQADLAGQSGLEYELDAYLHGIDSTDQVEVDSGERPVRLLRRGHPVPGDSVYLTIDWKLQQQVARDLAAGLHQLNLRQGIAIVEDVRNGQILSMVSLPSFDPNLFSTGTGIKQKEYTALMNDPAHPLNDQAAGGLFPPGSTYKIITATAALQTHVADASRTINDGGFIRICSMYDGSDCRIFNGWKPGGLGPVNVVTAIAKSSDIYFYTVAGGDPNVDPNMPRIGADRLAAWARKFGFGSPIGLNIPNEEAGLIPSRTWYEHQKLGGPYRAADHPLWSIGDTYNMAIGQGLNWVTPLQIVNMAATIANGGTVYRPNVLDSIKGRFIPRLGSLKRERVLQPFAPTILRRDFIDPDNLALIQEGMHESVQLPVSEDGTSYNVADPRFDPAGKTGTAEAPGGPDAWWVGYAPFHNPKVAVVVLIPHAFSEGATASAPIAHKIFEDYFHLPPLKKNWLSDVIRFLVPTAGTDGRAG